MVIMKSLFNELFKFINLKSGIGKASELLISIMKKTSSWITHDIRYGGIQKVQHVIW